MCVNWLCRVNAEANILLQHLHSLQNSLLIVMHIATAQMIGVALLGGINQVTSYNMLGGSGYQYVLHHAV